MLDCEDNWQDMLRNILPREAPLPDSSSAGDYTIASQYPESYGLPRHEDVVVSHTTKSVSVLSEFGNESSKVHHGGIFPRVVEPVSIPISRIVGLVNSPCQSPRGSGSSESVVSVLQNQEFSSDSRSDSGGSSHCQQSRTVTEGMKEIKLVPVVTIRTSEKPISKQINYGKCISPCYNGVSKKEKRKGACFLCGKKKWERKESCLVCNAKYCSSCILRAMGSMPEGRKCVTCIGQSIDETKRSRLGKSPRILIQLLSPLEVRQILKAERECPSNQVRAEQVVINGTPLRTDEMVQLLSCPLPPQKLKAGKYWYDRESGLWGKDGEKPDRIISSNLNFSGKLSSNASDGNTQVYMNGREITKVELRVLKLGKVHCPRGTHFWVYNDGRYEKEGQGNIKGKFWDKASTRLLCSLFSLPVPQRRSECPKDEAYSSSGKSVPDFYLEQKGLQKLLLLGLHGSGTSTIFKQVKFLHGNKFTVKELHDIKLMIQRNMYKYLSVLLEGRERFEEEELYKLRAKNPNQNSTKGENLTGNEPSKCVYSINTRLKQFSNWLLDIIAMGDLDAFFPSATREYAHLADEIWNHVAIQETYKRRNELHFLPDVAEYFLSRALEISSDEYEPSEKDIIYAEGVTHGNGLAIIDFSLDERNLMSVSSDDNLESTGTQTFTKYQLIRVSAKGMNEGCKWVEMFEDARVVIFSVALSDYNVLTINGNGRSIPVQNKMILSKELFERTIRNPCFRNTPFVLVLNKFDLFEEKVNHVDICTCEWFSDFSPVNAAANHSKDQSSLAHQAYYYVAMKFKELYSSITNRKLFVWKLHARNPETVDGAFRYIREVLKWDQEKDKSAAAAAAAAAATVEDSSFCNIKVVSSRQSVRR